MGDAKRRKEVLGDRYGKEDTIAPWFPFTKTQSEQFVKVTTRLTWIGIGALVVIWITIRIIGPAFGWWQVN